MCTTDYGPGNYRAHSFVAAAFADCTGRQAIHKLGHLKLASKTSASPLWRGVDVVAVAEQIDAEIAGRPDAHLCPRLADYATA